MTKTETVHPAPSFSFERIAPVFFLILVDVMGLSVILPLLHLYAARFNATPFEIGVVVAAFPLAQLIGVPLMGSLSDRFGRKPLLLISQVTTCAGFLLLGFAQTLTLVIASRVLDGLFGANIATAQAALTDITDKEDRARALGLTGAAFGIGFVLGPIISAVSLSFTDNLSIPAYIAAGYSLLSIFLTLFFFTETLPPEKRDPDAVERTGLFGSLQMLRDSRVNLLLVLIFAQQVVFFGFESLLGVFTLNRLGLLGQGNAYVFLVVGIVLVVVQGRMIGLWSQKYGSERLVHAALALIAVGLILIAFTPRQPPYNYVQARAERELQARQAEGEALGIDLPDTDDRGLWGVPWLLLSIIPLSVGSGLIRPSLNTLMTLRVQDTEYGLILGVSAAFVSAANAIAPVLGGWVFQTFGSTAPFLAGGIAMAVLAGISVFTVRR